MLDTQIAFLRAVNVGGRNVSMERLRGLFEARGLTGVRTYIQSGNVFFQDPQGRPRDTLRQELEGHLESELGFAVPVMLRSLAEVDAVLKSQPFAAIEVTPETRLCVLFLVGTLPADLALPLAGPRGEFEVIGALGPDAFVVSRVAGGRVPNPGQWIEKQYGVAGTARFFHTLEKIAEAARGTK